MKNSIFKYLFLLLAFFSVTSIVNASNKDSVKFEKCIDGDTASFILNKEIIKVRFLAIDTPETVHPTKEAQKFGKNASEYTCNKISKAKKIILEYDEGSTKTDKYNRNLAWVWVDGSLLQKELVSIGYAKVKYIYGNYLYTDALYELEDIAKSNNLGVWNSLEAKLTVFFDIDGKITKKEINENDKLEYFVPDKTDHEFSGWYIKNKKFDFNTRVIENITLTAKFERKLSYMDFISFLLFSIVLYFVNKKAFKKKLKKLF